MFIAAQCTIAKTREQTKCPLTVEWIKKTLYMPRPTHNGILLRHLKNEIMRFAAAWVDLEINIVSEVRHKDKDNFHMISLICGIYQCNRNRLTDIELVVAKKGRIGILGLADEVYLYIKCINNEVLQHGTGFYSVSCCKS